MWDRCIGMAAIYRTLFFKVYWTEICCLYHFRISVYKSWHEKNSLIESTSVNLATSNLRKEIIMSSFYLVSFLLGSIYFINNSRILIFSIFRMCSADFIFYWYKQRFNDRTRSSKKSEISTDPSTSALWGLYSLLHDFSGEYTVDASVR